MGTVTQAGVRNFLIGAFLRAKEEYPRNKVEATITIVVS